MFRKHGVPQSRIEFLRSVPTFEGLSDKVLARIDGHLNDASVPAGRELTHQGAAAYEAFIVVEGEADVLVDGTKIDTTGPGNLVGEVGVLQHTSRNATVVARTPMRLLVVDPREIHWLFEDPTLAARIRDNEARHHGAAPTS